MRKCILLIELLLLLFLALSTASADVAVRFDANGGTDAPGSIHAKTDADGITRFDLPTEKPKRSGYRFIGWNCEGLEYEYPLDSPGKSIAFDIQDCKITTYYTLR